MSSSCPIHPAADGLVRVYPSGTGGGPALVWAHGGAFAFGDLDMPEADGVSRELARSGVTVISVDYRLAPLDAKWASAFGEKARDGARFPAQLNDMSRAWEWTVQHADRLGIDPRRITIGGASAGANLAAATVLRLLQERKDLPHRAALVYPTLLAVQSAPAPELEAALRAETGGFEDEGIRSMYENYVGTAAETVPLLAAPGLASLDDLVEFPATLVLNADIDIFRVSGEAFAASLARAGRHAEVFTESGTRHGHLNAPEGLSASGSIARLVAWIHEPPGLGH